MQQIVYKLLGEDKYGEVHIYSSSICKNRIITRMDEAQNEKYYFIGWRAKSYWIEVEERELPVIFSYDYL